MSFEYFSNNTSTTLASDIDNAVTSLTVSSNSGFPSSGNFRILIEQELLLVTAVSGTTFTVIRGVEGTVATSHLSGITISQILTAGAINTRFSQMIVEDSFNDPTTPTITNYSNISTNPGRLLINKAGYLYLDNGSSWDGWGGIQPISTVLLTNITGNTSNNNHYSDVTGNYFSKNNSSPGTDAYTFYSTSIATDGVIVAKINTLLLNVPTVSVIYEVGLFMMNSSTLHRIIFGFRFDNGTYSLISYDMTDQTINSTYLSYPIDPNAYKWIGLRKATNLEGYVSLNGITAYNIGLFWGSADVSSFDQCGVFLNANVGNLMLIAPYISIH